MNPSRPLRAATSWLEEPIDALEGPGTAFSIAPRYGTNVRSGIAIYQLADAARVVRAVVERGSSVATHAIGNAAIDVALGAYDPVVGGALCEPRPVLPVVGGALGEPRPGFPRGRRSAR